MVALPSTTARRSTAHSQAHSREQSEKYEDTMSENISGEKSFDLTQRLERKLAEYNASRNVFKRWLFEIGSWLLSAICMTAIVVIYVRINNESMERSNTALTTANVLGKIASAALIVPTSEALGQLKWNWFQNSRAVWDFEIFDKASRGPWGAALLLFRTRGRSLAALGALLIVLLLAIDTFFQQVIVYPDEWILQNATSAISRVIRYDPPYVPDFFEGWEELRTDSTIKVLASSYFLANGTFPVLYGNGYRPEVPLSCPTSNCTWPEYETLAVCSECIEMDSHDILTYACLDTAIDWTVHYIGKIENDLIPRGTACGYFINATSTTPTLMSGYIVEQDERNNTTGEALLVRVLPLTNYRENKRLFGTGSINFSSKTNPIVDMLIASAPDGPESVYRNSTPILHECAITWCAKTMMSSYSEGQYSETVISKTENATGGPFPWTSIPIADELGGGVWLTYDTNITVESAWGNQSDSDAGTSNPVYGVGNETAVNVITVFEDFCPMYYTVDSATATPQLRYKNYGEGARTRSLNYNPLQAPNDITHHMDRLATAMTNVIRSSSSSILMPGNAYNREKIVRVHWEWLIFPMLLLILSLVFLVSTIIKTSRDVDTGLWKTSAMPTLINSLPKETQQRLNDTSTWRSASGEKKVRIKLLPDRSWRVSGQSQVVPSPRVPQRSIQPPPGWL